MTVKGGAAGVTDASGNPLAADYAWAFTTERAEYSIWADGMMPVQVDAADPASVEIGLKFSAAVDGFVSGVRFYKGPTNTGVHTGSLWAIDGTPLGSVTFRDESVSGWQQAIFAAPIPVTANTTYVVSYHAPAGHYAADAGTFATEDVVSGPLKALNSPVSLGNGVFAYGPSQFPTGTFYSSNYWVDVLFSVASGTVTPAPTVVAVSPAAGATGVQTNAAVSATFSESIDPASVTAGSIQLLDGAGHVVPATVSYTGGLRTASLQPVSPLLPSTTYTAVVHGGAGGILDSAGTALAADVTWTFSTEVPPAISISSLSLTEGNEGTTSAVLTVTLSAPRTTAISVSYATASGTASAGTDYVTTAGTVSFAPGTTSATIAIPVVGDYAVEPDETFFVDLSSPVNATIDVGRAVVSILNDDLPSIAIANASITEGNAGTANGVAHADPLVGEHAAGQRWLYHLERHRDRWHRLHGRHRHGDLRARRDDGDDSRARRR